MDQLNMPTTPEHVPRPGTFDEWLLALLILDHFPNLPGNLTSEIFQSGLHAHLEAIHSDISEKLKLPVTPNNTTPDSIEQRALRLQGMGIPIHDAVTSARKLLMEYEKSWKAWISDLGAVEDGNNVRKLMSDIGDVLDASGPQDRQASLLSIRKTLCDQVGYVTNTDSELKISIHHPQKETHWILLRTLSCIITYSTKIISWHNDMNERQQDDGSAPGLPTPACAHAMEDIGCVAEILKELKGVMQRYGVPMNRKAYTAVFNLEHLLSDLPRGTEHRGNIGWTVLENVFTTALYLFNELAGEFREEHELSVAEVE